MKSKNQNPPRSTSLFIAAALLVAIGPAACQVSAELSAMSENDQGGEGTSGGTSGGPEQDGSIVIEPPTGQFDPSPNPLADLCSADACAVGGDDAACAETEACQLKPADGTAIAACGPAGKSGDGFVCMTAQDCTAGMGCAATPNGGGVCRSYCCGDPEDCPTKTYCAAEPMAEDAENVAIPVCIPATVCQLLTDGACKDGLTCAIVRDDGTTSCIPPGPGQLNEPCPCADGFVCSKLTNQCKKLCHIGKDAEDCGGSGACQAGSSGFPEGFGVCVGGS